MSLELLGAMVRYDPSTGSMIWTTKPGGHGSHHIGGEVGSKRKGARETSFRGRRYGIHQVAWFLMTGEKPERGWVIDHINGDPFDNRFANLRRCSQAENCRNRSQTGERKYKGVHFYKSRNKWQAGIMLNRKQIHIGYYDTAEAAARAYDEIAKVRHGDFARLNFPKEQS